MFLTFIFTYLFSFIGVLYIFVWIWVSIRCPFISACKYSISISCRIDMLVTNTQILFIGMSLFLYFRRTEFLVHFFFFFKAAWVYYPNACCLCGFWFKIIYYSHWWSCAHDESPLSCCFQDTLSLSFQSLIICFRMDSDSLNLSCFGFVKLLGCVHLCLSSNLGKFLAIISLNILSAPSSFKGLLLCVCWYV